MKTVSRSKVFPIIAILLSALLAFSMLGFGASTAQAKSTSKKNSKVVVLYFSGTGNTRNVAKKIKKATGGTLIQVKAADPYTEDDLDYSNDNSRVVKEHESASTPAKSKVRPKISNLKAIKKAVKNADVVYIGYPIWWGEAPHIMYTLVENVSLKSKAVVPFNSSLSSGTGNSAKNLKKKAIINKKTKWLSGKSFYEGSLPSQKRVNNWVKKVNARINGSTQAGTANNNTGTNTANNGNSTANANIDNNTGNTGSKQTDVNTNTGNSGTANTDTKETDPTATGKTLVVYYSASGNTERVAREIATAANADLFEITPSETYTSADLNWTNADSRVNREHENPDLQNQVALTTTTVPDWSSYDTVYIGYPIWWGIAAWPVNGFVTANDFTGKTVIPFCTSSSSPIGASGTNLAAMAGTGNWQTGHRFSGSASQSDVTAWVQSLNQN